MKRTKRIKNILEEYLKDYSIVVVDNSYLHKGHHNFDGNEETHISIKITKNSQFKLNRLVVHKKINSLLSKEFDNGLHSLEIKII